MKTVTFLSFIIFLLLGTLFFYDWGYWNYIDEALALLMAIALIVFPNSQIEERRLFFKIILSVIIGYFIYSFFIHSNNLFAICLDALIFLKPFAAFAFAFAFGLTFSRKQKQFIALFSLLLIVILLIYWAVTPRTDATIAGTLFPGSRLAGIVFQIAVLYYICTPPSKKKLFIFLLILSLGWLRATSKFMFLYCCIVIILFFNFSKLKGIKFYLLMSTVFVAGCMIGIYVVWDDITFFVIEGIDRRFARPMLYETAYKILIDKFPFGSGFASFATSSSGNYYSDIYNHYGIDDIDGLEERNTRFISDTFYPALAQFGIFGIILFSGFFIWCFKKLRQNYLNDNKNYPLYISGIFLLLHYLIESISDSTFISNRGLSGLFILGLILSEMEFSAHKENNKNVATGA